MSLPIELADQNPWWRNKEAINEDIHIAVWKASKVPWNPRIQHTFDFVDSVYTIRGPRQVGKTTLTKLIVMNLLERVDPRRILYYTCDLVSNPRELTNIIASYLDWLRSFTDERAFIFLDEVSSIREWQRAIKHLVDVGKLRSATVILTGSHTLDVKAASERLPGRRGAAEGILDKILLPMKFSEYVETLSKEIESEVASLGLRSWERKKSLIQMLYNGRVPSEFNRLTVFLKDLNNHLKNYLLTGGMPRVVDDYQKTGKISEGVYRTFVDIVRGDLVKWAKRESYLRQVMSRVVETLSNPVGWNTLKQNTDIASHNTVADYIDALKDSFTLIYLHQFDMARKAPLYQKEKKIYFHDPFFLHALRGWISGRDPYSESLEFLRDAENVGRIAEGVATDHLVRLAFHLSGQKQLFEYENRVFFWRGKKDREVDLILRLNDKYLPIEVKYQSSIRRSDLYGVIDFEKGAVSPSGLILAKEKLQSRNKITIVPLTLFLMLV
jgi:predicted AAA+ superfamily ATPase